MESYERKQLIYKFILVIVFVACVTTVITFYATFNCMESNYFLVTGGISEDSSKNINTISDALKNFRTLIDEYYIGDINEENMVNEAIKGYVNGLEDEYSEYMTADEWEEYQINTLGNYVGIGIYMSQDNSGRIVVVEPIEGSPAEAAGLQKEDLIVEVDGENIIGQDISLVSSKIKGEEGTLVRLKIIRGDQYLTLDVERKAIKVYHVKDEMLDNDTIGYIKLSAFDEGCSNEFRTALEKVKEQGAKKLIIDLRDNTGGLVDEALNMADMLLPKDKTILITKDNKDTEKVTKSEIEPIIDSDMDIVVLVNQYSASASEILVGSLKDNEVATIAGTTTYGKGVIQNVFSLSDGSILKLTTAEYFTPNGTRINKKGIEPNFFVQMVDENEGEAEVDEQLNKAIDILNAR